MDWLELKIDTSHAGLDAVTDMLEQQGVTGVMIDDEADFQSFLENNRQYWDYVDDELLAQKKGVSRVTFYLERNEDAYGTVAAVRMAMSALKKEHPEYAPLLLTMIPEQRKRPPGFRKGRTWGLRPIMTSATMLATTIS